MDISGAHPYWAYPFSDVAVVHNGQLTNYFQWKRRLERERPPVPVRVRLGDHRGVPGREDGRGRRASRTPCSRASRTSTGCSPTWRSPRTRWASRRTRWPRSRWSCTSPTTWWRWRREEIAIRARPRSRDRHLRPLRERGAGVDTMTGTRRTPDHLRRARAGRSPSPRSRKSPRSTATRRLRRGQAHDPADQPRAALADLRAGIRDVTVLNPGAKHSIGVGILQRCRIRFEGCLGYFGLGLIDGPEITVTGRVGWSVVREHDVGRRRDREERGLADRRGDARRRPRREGRRRRAHRDRPEGRHDHRRRRRRHDDRLHDAAGPA